MKDDIIVGHLLDSERYHGFVRFFCCHLLVSMYYKGNGRIIFIAKKYSCVLISYKYQPYEKFLTPKFSRSTVDTLNKNTLGVKKVRGQSEATMVI